MRRRSLRGIATTLLVLLTVSGVDVSVVWGEEVQQGRSVIRRAPKARRSKTKPETAASWHARRGLFFERNWGVDIVGIRRVSSGVMLRFDYRIVDPSRAAGLSDKRAKPYLIDELTGTVLAVPALENIGELRQLGAFQVNRTYFIIFGNPGGLVKHGGRVTLMVGDLRAEGLVVD